VIRDHRPAGLPVERSCQLLNLSRSEYYECISDEAQEPIPDDLLEEIVSLTDERTAYGYRRVGANLRKRGNAKASDKKVRTRMRKLGLNRRRKRRKPRTTIPGKGPASPNLAADLNLTGLRELLVTDITYVALPRGFAYVSVILDAFSRRALGWAASESLATELPLEALEMVLSSTNLSEGWIHHSDRGCQYTSSQYKERVLKFKGQLSNSKPGCPYDNAKMESFFKTYKYEEANLQEFLSIQDLRENLASFLNDYNSQRLHSSIGYCSPIEFEILHAQANKQMCVR